MNIAHPAPSRTSFRLFASLIALVSAVPAYAASAETRTPVNYEDFGAKGDGVTDDLEAIVTAHAHANKHGMPVRTRPDATYHLGTRALTVVIQTDTDWNTSRFIIDDSKGVENNKRPLFEVTSRLAPVELTIERLKRGQEKLDIRPEHDLLVMVENSGKRLFIRRGLNQNSGSVQREAFILRRDGTIEGAIEWDYDTVTKVEAQPIDAERLVVCGGFFHQIANQMVQPQGYNYWSRDILIKRSNTEVDGVTLEISGEGEFGHPYAGFLRANNAANVTFRNCRIPGRKVYQTIGSAGKPVSMGTYGYNANYVVNFSMINCRMENIHDTTRWGVAASNFMKNVLVEDCVLSRMDVHQGVSGHYTIRRTVLGHAGLNAVGKGLLLVEDSEIHSTRFIAFRGDYGSPWDGEVVIRNSRWIPPSRPGTTPSVFNAQNDGTHDFGYPCMMPRSITIDGLEIDDGWTRENKKPGVTFFDDVIGKGPDPRPFPYPLTEYISVRNLKTASGVFPAVSPNETLRRAIRVERR
ncbi:MAG: hypothetical protein MUE42_01360 [Opitutaceae bacterium]|jgi:hypothetical protein|nr:hypothetical protein [Opitutaceae bacterium]